jgi:hypothetical protein
MCSFGSEEKKIILIPRFQKFTGVAENSGKKLQNEQLVEIHFSIYLRVLFKF